MLNALYIEDKGTYLIDKCLDEKNYDDAKIFADIWNNRRSSK